MSIPLFDKGIQGLSDSLWSGAKGSCSKLVGIDYRTTPGTFKAHQKLSKHSGTTIDQLCKNVVNCSDGSRIWFSSESGKIWREVSGTYTLVHTTVPTLGEAKCLGAMEYHDDIYWATELYLHKIEVRDLGNWTLVTQNWAKFLIGDDSFHPMTVQNLKLYVGDKTTIASVDKPPVNPEPRRRLSVSFSASEKYTSIAGYLTASGNAYPRLSVSARETSASASSITKSITVPNESDRVMVVFVTGVRTDDNLPATPTATYNGDAMTNLGIAEAFWDVGTDISKSFVFKLVSPDVGTGDLVVTFAGAETNLVVQAVVFRGATNFTSADSTASGGTATSITETNIGTVGTNYDLPVIYVHSDTTTQTIGTGQIAITNTTNTWGNDSTSYYGELPDFTQRTEFNVLTPERIQTIKDFDIDILVGTRVVNKARVLRWDGLSEGWSAQDDIDEQGINAFILDDNFMYVQAGFYGRLYFYNGEKLDPYQRIPGEWSPTKTAKINPNATAFHLGVPVFGLTNVAGNPTLQGIYGFGSYGIGYTKSLSLDFPIPTNAFSGVEIGAIVTDGADLYASYKDGTDVGVAKLDWTAKYTAPYLETVALISPENRSDFTNIQGMSADYVDLPANTDITFSYKKNYDSSFTALSSTYLPKLKQVKARESITDISNLIVKVAITTSANATPQVENISLDI